MDAPQSDPPTSSVIDLRRYNVVCLLVLTIGWLGPIAWHGLSGNRRVPYAGKHLNDLYRVSCLFTDPVHAWSDYYIQVQLEGESRWHTLDEHDYSTFEPFSRRTRLHRKLSFANSQTKAHGMLQRQHMSLYVRDRYAALHDDAPPVVAVRFWRASYRTGRMLAREKGPWVHKPYDEVDSSILLLISTHTFDGADPVDREGRPVRLRSANEGFEHLSIDPRTLEARPDDEDDAEGRP